MVFSNTYYLCAPKYIMMMYIFIVYLLFADSSCAISPPLTSNRPIIFLNNVDRLNSIKQKVSTNNVTWIDLKNKIDSYPSGKNIYVGAIGEFAAANALAYRLTGQTKYLDRSKELFWGRYIDSNSPNYWDYTSRNGFRSDCEFAVITYDWIYSNFSTAEKTQIQTIFKTWAQYWVSYVNYSNNFAGFRQSDTDETTSLAHNIALLGFALYGDDSYANTCFDVSDAMLAKFVVAEFMDGYMKGGVWAEGTDYNPGTVPHWIKLYMINKDGRGIDYPNDYHEKYAKYTLFHILPDWKGVFNFGDVENATDFHEPWDFNIFHSMVELSDIVADNKILGCINYYIQKIRNEGKRPVIYTGIWSLLFEKSSAPTLNPDTLGNYFLSDKNLGVRVIIDKTGWSSEDAAFFFLARTWHADHEHSDCLSFDIYKNGQWITKRQYGYGRSAWDGSSHNSLLTQNGDTRVDGQANPMLKPVGEAKILSTESNQDYLFVTAEGAPTWNYASWDGSKNYYDNVKRSLFWLKSINAAIVYDYIKVNLSYHGQRKKALYGTL